LTRSAAEESSCGNDASNGEGGSDPEGKGGADSASGHPSGDHWTGRVKRTRRKDHVVSAGDGETCVFGLTFWLLVFPMRDVFLKICVRFFPPMRVHDSFS
jgi:hypothetical protein